MAFFQHSHESEETSSGRRNSVRDLSAKAYATWVQGAKPRRSSHVSGFEAERARRQSLLEEAGLKEVVMRT